MRSRGGARLRRPRRAAQSSALLRRPQAWSRLSVAPRCSLRLSLALLMGRPRLMRRWQGDAYVRAHLLERDAVLARLTEAMRSVSARVSLLVSQVSPEVGVCQHPAHTSLRPERI